MHVVLGPLLFTLFLLYSPRLLPEKHTKAETVTIERRVPTPTPSPRPTPTPAPESHAPAPAPKKLTTTPPPPAEVPRHEIAVQKPVAPPVNPNPVQHGKAKLSKTQIAKIQSDLGAAIAQDRNGLSALNVPPAPTPGLKHYQHDFSGFSMGDSHGKCDPLQNWQDDGWNYYYVACNVVFDDDGHTERQTVPWPVRFRPNADPFAGTVFHDVPLAGPLPGYKLPPGVYVSKELRDYATRMGTPL